MVINKKGFTLTEILLAVVIVGLIGVALAALTTSASREASSGKSRITLRGNLSQFVRKLRNDVQSSSRIMYAAGNVLTKENTASKKAVLVLGKNLTLSGDAFPGRTATYVAYCFESGNITQVGDGSSAVNVQPAGNAWDGGKIYRKEIAYSAWTSSSTDNICSSMGSNDVILTNVKLITNDYRVPYFNMKRKTFSSPDAAGVVTYYTENNASYNAAADGTTLISGDLVVRLITELTTAPVINEVIEEEFFLPIGIYDAGQGERTSYHKSDY